MNRDQEARDYSDLGQDLDLASIEQIYSFTKGMLSWNFDDVYLDGDLKRKGEKDHQVFVGQHKSYWDPLILAFAYYSRLKDGEENEEERSLLKESEPEIYAPGKNGLTFAAGDHVMRDGWVQDFLNSLGAFTVDSGLSQLRDYMAQQLQDYDLLIFPEVHKEEEKRTGRSFSGKVGNFSSLYLGGVKKAVNGEEEGEGVDVDLVPIDITYEALPEGTGLISNLQDSDQNRWQQVKGGLQSSWLKIRTFLRKGSFPAHLSLGEAINYQQQDKQGKTRKEIGEELEKRAHSLVKPTPANVVAYAKDTSKTIGQVYQLLKDESANISLLGRKSEKEIRKEGKKVLSGLFSSQAKEHAIDFYSNQIEHLTEA